MIRVVVARLGRYRSFYKFTALHAVGVFLLGYAASRLTNMDVQGQPMPFGLWFERPTAWGTVAALARWLFYFPAFFTVQIVCAELELKLVRAQVIAGQERRDVVLGWLLQSVILTLVAVAMSLLTAAALGHAAPSGAWDLASALRVELGFALYGLVFLSCAVLAAALMRRPVPALAVLFLWPIAAEPLLGFTLGHYGFEKWRDYLPFTSLGSLVPWPGTGATFDPTASMTIVSLGYGVAVVLLTWLHLAKRDL